MKLLNVGCGRCYHPDWINIDLVAASPEVREYDLRQGLPYEDNTFDAVYHSHVLEHLTPADAAGMLGECRRVLKPMGILRVVVPDLEGIARAYLATIDDVTQHETELGLANHRWMTLELVDQMTRLRSGGEMGSVMRDPNLINRDFVRSRLGHEVDGNTNGHRMKKSFGMRISRLLADARKHAAMAAVTMFDGSAGRAAYREGRFRNSGEIHRWMYDRVSLAQFLRELGFEDPRVCRDQDSQIDAFDSYQLDRDGETPRKPDSMYMEAKKPPSVPDQSATRRSSEESSRAA